MAGGACATEGGFPLIAFLDSNVVVPPSYVHFREILGSFQFVNEGGDEGKRVGIFDRVLIEIAIILARSQSTVLFLNKETWGGLGGSGFPNLARLEVFIDERLTCYRLLRVHGIGFGYFRDEGFLQLYSMVKGSSRGKFPSLWFIEDFGIFGILGREFLFYLFSGLS